MPSSPIIIEEEARLVSHSERASFETKPEGDFDYETPTDTPGLLSQLMRVRRRSGNDVSDEALASPRPAFYPLTQSHSLPSSTTSFTASRMSMATSTAASTDDIHVTLDYVDQLLAQDSYRRLDEQYHTSRKSWWRRVFCMC